MKKLLLTCGGLVFLLVLAAPVSAEEKIDVSRMTYVNNGAYTVTVKIHGIRPDGSKFNRDPLVKLLPGKGSFTFWLHNYLTDRELGSEVWLLIDIMLGENKSCRKDDIKYYYAKGSTADPKFATSGETLTNNRCKINQIQ